MHRSLTDRTVKTDKMKLSENCFPRNCVFSSLQFCYVAISLTAHSTFFFPDCQAQGVVNTISVAF